MTHEPSEISSNHPGVTGRIPSLGLLLFVLLASLAAAQEKATPEKTGQEKTDPRIRIAELIAERQHRIALEAVEATLESSPETARALGFDYLRGDLLLELGRRHEALDAFAAAMGSAPDLEPWGRHRLARHQLELGYPEVAAGLLASLLSDDPPPSLADSAMRMFEVAIAAGGDCRLLRNLDRRRWSAGNRRRLMLAKVDCALRSGNGEEAHQLLVKLLAEKTDDPVALRAAALLAEQPPAKKRVREHLLLGLAFYDHREFETAIHHLAATLVQVPGDLTEGGGEPTAADVSEREIFECRYALARSHFWLGRYRDAATAFGNLALSVSHRGRRAQALYQRARCFELAGDWRAAIEAFDTTYDADPDGRWSDAALIANMRLRWLEGDEATALRIFETLTARRRHEITSRALIFLAASDLVIGRRDRAGAWLAQAEDLGRVPVQELHYWQGRFEELRGRPPQAAAHYARALMDKPQHPLAQAARRRLEGPEVAPSAAALARRMAASERIDDLYTAWLLSAPEDPRRGRLETVLAERADRDPENLPFRRMSALPATEWPLWQASLRTPEEKLLALSLFDEAAPVVLRHFPVNEPSLGFTGSLALARGGAIRRSLYIAEILDKRVPDDLPHELMPLRFRRLLYPFAYSFLILREARRHSIDPYLLAGVIREESRFEADAFSGAAARGLTQFVLPTARQVAQRSGIDPVKPEDLENPEVSIALGAAYLAQLQAEFGGAIHVAIAAYNAGEPQAALWRRYCLSDDPAEYMGKVAFRETRGYLAKVLTSRQHYRELYAPP